MPDFLSVYMLLQIRKCTGLVRSQNNSDLHTQKALGIPQEILIAQVEFSSSLLLRNSMSLQSQDHR
jgi:hypothetical protein